MAERDNYTTYAAARKMLAAGPRLLGAGRPSVHCGGPLCPCQELQIYGALRHGKAR